MIAPRLSMKPEFAILSIVESQCKLLIHFRRKM